MVFVVMWRLIKVPRGGGGSVRNCEQESISSGTVTKERSHQKKTNEEENVDSGRRNAPRGKLAGGRKKKWLLSDDSPDYFFRVDFLILTTCF